VGEPLPPALNIPRAVSDLRVVQRIDSLQVEFTIPDKTTEDLPLSKLEAVDLRIGRSGEPSFDLSQWESGASSIEVKHLVPGLVKLDVPASSWAGSDVALAVRLINRKGRVSEWSNVVRLAVVPPPGTPTGVRAESTAGGVRIAWSGPQGAFFRVYRAGRELATTDKSEHLDAGVEPGGIYSYRVQSLVRRGSSEAEGALSPSVEIRFQDTFPPAVPSNLTALSGRDSIELSWQRSTEPDFRGYRVYRATQDGPFQTLEVFLDLPAFSDRDVQPGKSYRYAVAAVDRAGNESRLSEPAGASIP
jgi:hypothetical protein